ncbi:MAG: helix-turn-helix domain-containing protein [Lachnospiraceae bacterium]|nr:helix-turn-helix domain-containing protein [Lachnospiraceae bacterium]
MKRIKTALQKQMGIRLDQIREELGLTANDMAAKINVSPAALRSYFRGEVLVGTDTLEELVKVFNINPAYLFIENEKEMFLSDDHICRDDDWHSLQKLLNEYFHLTLGLPEDRRRDSLKMLLEIGAQLTEY